MEELHKIGTAYFQNATREHQDLGQKFFKAMDKDGDQQISLHEYLAFMKNEGHAKMANTVLFKKLNKSGSGKLDPMEAMTLLYIIESGRKFCDGCGEFIAGMFFSCSDWFDKEDKSFNVCYECFKQKIYVHSHGKLLDNYVLLEKKRLEAVKEKKAAKKRQKEEERKKQLKAEAVLVQPIPVSQQAMVAYNPHQRDIWRHVLGGVVAGVVSMIAPCSIM